MITHNGKYVVQVDSSRERVACHFGAEVCGIDLEGVPQIEDEGLQPTRGGKQRELAPLDEAAATRDIARACRELQRRKGIWLEREYA